MTFEQITTQAGHLISFEPSTFADAFWMRIDPPQSPLGARAAERVLLTLSQSGELRAALDSAETKP